MQAQLRDIDWNLLAIRVYTFLYNTFQLVSTQTVKSLRYLKNSFEPELYGFYQGSFLPVPVRQVSDGKPGATKAKYLYDRDSKTILGHSFTNFHTLTFQDAKLYHGDICLYDLTNFFEDTFYCVEEDVPPLQIWIGAWCLENGVFLDMNTEFTLKVQTYLEEEKSFQIWNCENEDWNRFIHPVTMTRHTTETVAEALEPALAPAPDSVEDSAAATAPSAPTQEEKEE